MTTKRKPKRSEIMWCLAIDGQFILGFMACTRRGLIRSAIGQHCTWREMREAGYAAVRVRVTEL